MKLSLIHECRTEAYSPTLSRMCINGYRQLFEDSVILLFGLHGRLPTQVSKLTSRAGLASILALCAETLNQTPNVKVANPMCDFTCSACRDGSSTEAPLTLIAPCLGGCCIEDERQVWSSPAISGCLCHLPGTSRRPFRNSSIRLQVVDPVVPVEAVRLNTNSPADTCSTVAEDHSGERDDYRAVAELLDATTLQEFQLVRRYHTKHCRR